MPKNILQDVLGRERKTIRQVPLPSGRKDSAPDEDTIMYDRQEVALAGGKGGGWSRFALWGVAVLFLLLLSAFAALGFRGAVITVTPKSASVSIEHSFLAVRSGAGDALHFESVPIVKTLQATVAADTEKRVSEKASGRIVIYNTFGEKPQRLIKNTRFETPGGLIYRIDKSVMVPGRSREGTTTVPGSVEVTVYADSPGGEYNIPLTDFTIPGFKNDTARFSGFYARSKTPITGGREGMVKTPSENAEREARAKLRAELKKSVTAAAKEQTPEGFILFEQAISFSAESLPSELKDKDTAILKEKASAVAYLFKQSELAGAIAKQSIRAYNGLPVLIPNLSDLTFGFDEASAPPVEVNEKLRFTLQGSPQIVWVLDKEKLRAALAGKQRDELASVLSAFPTIERVEVVLRPFWSRRFPENPKKVTIEIAPAEAAGSKSNRE